MEKEQNYPFPDKTFLVLGVLCGLLIPILITIILTLHYRGTASVALIAKVYLVFFANLILINVHTYISKSLYAKMEDQRLEVVLSGMFVIVGIVFFNFIFLNYVFLGKRSSTDVFILFIIPVFGSLLIVPGYFLGRFIKKIRMKLKERRNKA